MRVGRLVSARPDAVGDRMRRLVEAGLVDAAADQPVELREARAGPAVVERALVHGEQGVEQLVVTRVERPRTDVLRVVAPVAVRADPDLEQRRLVLLYGPMARSGERPDPRPRPHEREAERELDLALPAGAFAVDEALPERGRLALLHSRLELARDMLHRRSRDFVRDAHPPQLLSALHP